MPNFSGKWTLTEQTQGIADGAWTGIPLYELYTFGLNTQGQLGLGDTITLSSPAQVGSLTTWSQVSTKNTQTGAIKTDGTLWTWGSNGSGRLGLNDTINRSSPVQVGALTTWSQVSAGNNSTAAIKTDGTLWTWGDGANGKTGQNDTVDHSSPVQVGSLTTWSQVSAQSYAHTIAINQSTT